MPAHVATMLPPKPETRIRQCPDCGSLLVKPAGHVAVHGGTMRSDYICRDCTLEFVYCRERPWW